jgi:predicted AlkP superfamily pyrophosphatase or phosphodiesterase
MEKVILISIDGMRPDGFLNCGHPFIHRMMELGAYTLNARTVFPSVTLPCHMSLFHSVTPERHGITTNLYMPMVRPLRGLFEQLSAFRKVSAMYYGWEPLRDVARPESLKFAAYLNAYAEDATDASLTDMALERIRKSKPDFVFLYMVETDEKGGHDHGWMSQAYLDCISAAIDNVRRVYEEFGDEYTIIITADHGGHDRCHGTAADTDMTIPQFYIGPRFTPGQVLENVRILDTTPTIADLMGIPAEREWEGRSLANPV